MSGRLVLLADAQSSHTIKWASELADRRWDVHVISLRPGAIAGVEVHALIPRFGGKLGYLTVAGTLKTLVRRLKPDILHAHYATSYGLLGALCDYHPFIISVWGSDVYDFPRKSPFHRMTFVRNLRAADAITSTSHAMAHVARLYVPERSIEVVPFGVDPDRFVPGEEPEIPTVGCVKALEPIYGQSDLIQAFRLIVERNPQRPLRLLLVGDGSQRDALEDLASQLGVATRTTFVGAVPPADVPRYLRQMTVYAMPSWSESFGVSALEASSCGLPVVATWVGGIGEVVHEGQTGLLVPPRTPEALADALERLLDDPSLRAELGSKGRTMVRDEYTWRRNADSMEAVYDSVVGRCAFWS